MNFAKPGVPVQLALFFAALVGAYLAFAPLYIFLPEPGLDFSWRTVLGEAGSRHLSVGKDLIFTGGPLSSLYTGYLDEQLVWPKLGLRFLLVIALAGLVAFLAISNRRPLVGLSMAVALATITSPRDALFLALPMLTGLAALGVRDTRLAIATFLLGIVATAAATLAKFSAAPLAILAFVVIDAAYLYGRRLPLFLVSYFAALFGLFALVDTPSSFIPYIANSLSVAAGYGDAMWYAGPPLEIAGFLALAVALLLVIAATELRAVRDKITDWPSATGRVVLISAYVFLAWKAGFIRQDTHTFIAWTGLAIAGLSYALIAPHLDKRGWLSPAPVIAFGIFLGFFAPLIVIPWVWTHHAKQSPLLLYQRMIHELGQSVADTRQFAMDPKGWLQQRKARKKVAWEATRAKDPLPSLQGSVDVIPSIQSSLLANGLDYKPRPSFQEYGTYTKRLIEINRHSLVNNGPAFLLFQPGSIDGRHPAMAEGSLWPDIIRYYQPEQREGHLLVLRRREQPLDAILGEELKQRIRLKQEIALTSSNGPLFLTARIRKTWLGNLASLLFRPPPITLHLKYADGQKRKYRVIPAMAQAGFVVSPVIETAYGFLLLATGQTDSSLPSIARLSFRTNWFGRYCYRPMIEVGLRPILSAYLKSVPIENPAIGRSIAEHAQLVSLLASASRPGAARLIPQGLLAEAPVTLTTTLSRPASAIRFTYGIADGAWQPADGTDGVCFSVALRRDTATNTLFERCLDPKTEETDRSEQTAILSQPLKAGDVVTFLTTCRVGCAYDWSYWSNIAFD